MKSMKQKRVGVAMGMVLAGALAPLVAGAEDKQEAQPSVAKVYLTMPSPNVDVTFRPFYDYSPAVNANPGGRKALESEVAAAVSAPADELTAELRQALLESLGNQASLTDLPVNVPATDKHFGKTLAGLPFMQRRNAPLTVAISTISLSSDYAGTLVNPNQVSNSQMGFGQLFKNLGNSVANLDGKAPLTFDGVARLAYQVQYKVYSTATGELLREGKVGPLTAESQPWQGSWTFPPRESFFDVNCDARGVCTNTYSQEKAAKLVTDPRPVILPETIAKIKPQVKEAVARSFSDWPDLIAAGQELAAAKR